MLRLLLDEHISPVVAEQVRRRRPTARSVSIHQWRGGSFLSTEDSLVLLEAAAEGLTLLTYDCRTIPAVLKRWAEQGVDHAGVVFVDDRTIRQWDVGGQVRAIVELHETEGDLDWRNQIAYLRPAAK